MALDDRYPDIGQPATLGAEQINEATGLWQSSAVEQRKFAQQHAGHSDIAGAGYTAQHDRRIAFIFLVLLLYACTVALLISGFNLPTGRSWLVAAGLIVLAFIATRIIRMRRLRGRLLPR